MKRLLALLPLVLLLTACPSWLQGSAPVEASDTQATLTVDTTAEYSLFTLEAVAAPFEAVEVRLYAGGAGIQTNDPEHCGAEAEGFTVCERGETELWGLAITPPEVCYNARFTFAGDPQPYYLQACAP